MELTCRIQQLIPKLWILIFYRIVKPITRLIFDQEKNLKKLVENNNT